ncbi:hypothetical protein [Paenibacillus sp. NAIST15-1]|nr:hypothetical protein [Paenibacillus sp. NAIST15-1]GAV13262.1 hypothetical protein PBN151_3196 [Paenibacillus sp. NAIST15-1]
MQIPDKLLDHLADVYCKSAIDPAYYPFWAWASVEAERLGFRFQ